VADFNYLGETFSSRPPLWGRFLARVSILRYAAGMRRGFLGTILALGFCTSLAARADEKHPTPKVDVDIAWTGIYQDKLGLFLVISNPQDFDVYVGNCMNSTTSIQSDSLSVNQIGDGCPIRGPEDFLLVTARSKRLLTIGECHLFPGENRFGVRVSSWVDPKIKLPWNYLVIGERGFTFSVPNPERQSR
jgi:hypothetical protein